MEAGTKGLWHLLRPGPPGDLTGRQGARGILQDQATVSPRQEDFWWPSAGGMKVPGPALPSHPSPGAAGLGWLSFLL